MGKCDFNISTVLYHDIKNALNSGEQIKLVVQPKLRRIGGAITGFFLYLFLLSIVLYGLINLFFESPLSIPKFIILVLLALFGFHVCKEVLFDAFRKYSSVYVITDQRAILVEKTKEGNKVQIFSEKEITSCCVVRGILGQHILFSEIDISLRLCKHMTPCTSVSGVGFYNLSSEQCGRCLLLLSECKQSEETTHS